MFGVYIHFPYCRKRCPYCDFAIHVRRRIPHGDYASAVLRELAVRAPLFAGRTLASVYFGGGTPSLWAPEEVARVLAGVLRAFPTATSGIEVTLEANPDDLPRSTLSALRGAGVNRLSVGAQSFDARSLALLGRDHGPDEARRVADDARSVGFDNLSFDLIQALPGQSPADLDRELDALLALGAAHLSLYQLTVERRTPFFAYVERGSLVPMGGDAAADLFERARDRLEAAGYTHYEVSSHARPGRRAVHNSLYWSGGEWLGLGSSSHSFRRVGGGGERWSNARNVDAYLRGANALDLRSAAGDAGRGAAIDPERDPLVEGREPLDGEALAREAMWLGLRRLDEGVDRAAYRARFGVDPVERFASILSPLVAAGLVEVTAERVRLSRRGVLLADEIGLRFL